MMPAPTLLDYAFYPEPDPLQASVGAQLTLAVSNGQREIVTCTSIAVTLPVGTNANDLTATASGIATTAPPGWNVAQSGNVFTLTPAVAGAANIGRDGLAFLFANVAVNDQIGTCEVRIDEAAALPSQPAVDGTTSLPLPKFPAQFTVSPLTATPPEVAPGGSTVLMWTGSSATYTVTYDPDGEGPMTVDVSSSGPLTVYDLTNAAGVTFTLTVDVAVPGEDVPLTVVRQFDVAVSVPKPVIASFTGTLSGVFTSDATANLTWVATGRDVSCAISGSPFALAASGSLVVPSATVARAASYTLTASNETASVTSELDIHWASRVSSISLGQASKNTAIARNGTRAYVCCAQSVIAVDMTTLATAGSPATFAQDLATVNVSPDGTRLYVTSYDENTITVLDAQTLAPDGAPITISLGSNGGFLFSAAISPDGSRLFVPAGLGVPVVAVVDLVARTLTGTIAVGAFPVSAAVSPDGSLLLVCNTFDGVAVIDTATMQPKQAPIPIRGDAKNVVFSPDGATAYVTYFLPDGPSAGLAAIDAKTLSLTGTPVTIGDQNQFTFGLTVSPDGAWLLCGAQGKLYVVGTNPLQLLTTVETDGLVPRDVQVSPDATVALVATAGSNSLGVVRLPWVSGGVSSR
jgi:DNA-binding beta-propeller fold protein YncE